MRRLRRALLILAMLVALLAGSVTWMLGTDSGTRWLLARAAGFLPAELTLGETRGSLLHGLTIASLAWEDEAIEAQVRDLSVDIQLLPLLARQVTIAHLDAERVAIVLTGRATADEPDAGPLDIDLPVRLSLESASVRNLSFVSGEIDRRIDRIGLQADMQGNELRIADLSIDSAWLDLHVAGRIELSDLFPARIEADWRWKESSGQHFAGQLQLEGDVRQYAVRHALVEPVQIATTGSVSYQEDVLAADLVNEWTALEWTFDAQRLYSQQGSLHVSGNAAAFTVDAAAVAQLDELPETRIALQGEADPGGIRFSHLEAGNAMGELVATGAASWDTTPQINMAYRLTRLDPSALADTIAGSIELDGTLDATLGDDGPAIETLVSRIGGELGGLPLQGRAHLTYTTEALSLSDTELRVGANSVRGTGRVGDLLALDVALDIADLSELLADAEGAIHGEVALQGSREHPELRANVTAKSLAWQTYALEAATIVAQFPSNQPGTAAIELQHFAAGETLVDVAHITASGRLDGHDVRGEFTGIGSKLVIEATGGYTEQAWTGQLDGIAISHDDLGRWASRDASKLRASAAGISLSTTCLFDPSGSGEVCAGVETGADTTATLALSAKGVPLSIFPVAMPAGMRVGGTIDAELQVNRTPEQLVGDATIDLHDASVEANYEDETLAVAFSRAAGRAAVRNGRIESLVELEMADGAGNGRLQLTVQDFTDVQSAIAGQGRLSIADTAFIAIFVPEISKPQGRIDGVMSISGSLNAPDFLGEILLTEGAFSVRQAGIDISGIEVRLAQLAPGQLQLRGEAHSGAGHITVQGNTQISSATGLRSELSVSGENFELARLPDWQITASPAVTAVFDDQTITVGGELTIPSADIKVRSVPASAQSPSPDAVVHRQDGKQPTARRRIDINLRAALGEDVQLEAFGLTTGLQGAVQLQGGTHAPYIGIGKLSLHDGRYKAYGQDLEIERGELLFNGALDNPQLDIRAIRRTTDVIAGIQLSGTPTQIRSEVFSEPSLSDADALSYLLTGRPLASATSQGEGDTLNNAAFALGLSGAGSIASQVRTELGLDTLTIEGGASDSRLIAGKRFGDRLLVEYGYGLIDKLGTLLLRYELNERIVLESRTGTVSNLDVVYRVKKK